jgi:hypothetical protein
MDLKKEEEDDRSRRLASQLDRIGNSLDQIALQLGVFNKRSTTTHKNDTKKGCDHSNNDCLRCPDISALLNTTIGTAQTLKTVHEVTATPPLKY